MNTQEACTKFRINVKDIRTLCKNGRVLGAVKRKGKWEIPDDTSIILTERQILQTMFNLLLLKNNPHEAISWGKLTNQKEDTLNLLSELGLITDCQGIAPNEWAQKIQLTKTGLEELFIGEKKRDRETNQITLFKSLFTFNILSV